MPLGTAYDICTNYVNKREAYSVPIGTVFIVGYHLCYQYLASTGNGKHLKLVTLPARVRVPPTWAEGA